jgi:hypothetical protein
VYVELSPGALTILPAWKLDAVYCAGLKAGPPQASLAALRSLHELLIACESRLTAPPPARSRTRMRHTAGCGFQTTRDHVAARAQNAAIEIAALFR